MKDIARVMTNNKEGEGMANTFGETSEVAKTLRCSVDRLSLCGRVIMGVVVNRFVETIVRNHANVGDLTVDQVERGPAVEGWGRETIEDVGNILKAEVPHIRWCVGSVHGAVDGTFDILPATFSENIRMMSASAWVLCIIGTHSTSRICITSVSIFWNVRLYSYLNIKT